MGPRSRCGGSMAERTLWSSASLIGFMSSLIAVCGHAPSLPSPPFQPPPPPPPRSRPLPSPPNPLLRSLTSPPLSLLPSPPIPVLPSPPALPYPPPPLLSLRCGLLPMLQRLEERQQAGVVAGEAGALLWYPSQAPRASRRMNFCALVFLFFPRSILLPSRPTSSQRRSPVSWTSRAADGWTSNAPPPPSLCLMLHYRLGRHLLTEDEAPATTHSAALHHFAVDPPLRARRTAGEVPLPRTGCGILASGRPRRELHSLRSAPELTALYCIASYSHRGLHSTCRCILC